jgi:asparagine synthase (glutamine-hydrolysing)
MLKIGTHTYQMCGILCVFGMYYNVPSGKLTHRGPDDTHVKSFGTCSMEFSRLAINDQSNLGMQPFRNTKGMLVCNGEIYNWRSLAAEYGIKNNSGSDCEILGELYNIFCNQPRRKNMLCRDA